MPSSELFFHRTSTSPSLVSQSPALECVWQQIKIEIFLTNYIVKGESGGEGKQKTLFGEAQIISVWKFG
jgi:hypothetical protein